MKKTLLALSAVAALALPASAETLGDMLREAGHEAIIGTWTDEASGSVTVTYAWSIEDHAIALTVNMGERVSKAIIGIDPETGDVVHNGYDNQGGSTTGRW